MTGRLPGPYKRTMTTRPWLRTATTIGVVALVVVEVVLAWPWVADAVEHLRAPQPGALVAAILVEAACIATYARMQRRLLLSGGVDVALARHLAVAYAARSLSITLPGGQAFAMHFKYGQLRGFGATPAVASWVVGLSAVLSSVTFTVIATVGALASGAAAPWFTLAWLVALALLLALGVRQLSRLHRPTTTWRILPPGAARRVTTFLDQLRAARLSPADAAPAIAFAGLSWLLDAGSLWLCCWAVGVRGTDAAVLLVAYCAAMAAGTLTLVPAGLGVIDGALVLGLVAAGAGSAAAIATVVLYRVVALGIVGGGGWLVWLALRSGVGKGPRLTLQR